MSEIINTAKVLKYTYTSGGKEMTGPALEATVSNPFIVPTVLLTKVCSVVSDDTRTAADLNEPILITHTVKNTSGAPIGFTTVTIQDPLFLKPSIAIIPNTEDGGTYDAKTNTITVTIPNDGTNDGILDPGESATYSVQVKVTSASAPSDILNTMAVATFTTATGTQNMSSDNCDLGYQHAEVSITKINNPDSSTDVTSDTVITYTIQIKNEGNTSATIAVGNFKDVIPAGTTFKQLTTGAPEIIYNAADDQIENGSVITLGPSTSTTNEFQIVFEVTVD